MKVLNIEEYAKPDGSPCWGVTVAKQDGTASKIPVVETEKPTYKIGDDIPYSNYVKMENLDHKGFYYQRKEGATQPHATTSGLPKTRQWKLSGRSAEEIESIERQSDKKAMVELYCHCTDASVPFDKKLATDIYKFVHQLGKDSPLVAEAKRLGAVEKP